MRIDDKPERTGNPYRFLYLLPAILVIALILRIFVFVSPEVRVRRVLDRVRKAANDLNVDSGMALTSEDFTVTMGTGTLDREMFRTVAQRAVQDIEMMRVKFDSMTISLSTDKKSATVRIDAGVTGKHRLFGIFRYQPGELPLTVLLEKRDKKWEIVQLDMGIVHF